MNRRRPAAAGAVLQRPAARLRRGGAPAAVDPVDIFDKYAKKEVVKVEDIPLSLLVSGEWIRCLQSTYEGKLVDFAGKVEKIEVDGTSWEAILVVTGTTSEDLLKYCTSVEKARVRAHLCRPDCDKKRTNPDLLHLKTVQKISPGEVLGWETNCETQDELPALRAAQLAWEGKDKPEAAEKVRSSSSSKEKTKKKKKEKKKEKKRLRKEKRKKMGGRANALKTTAALFSGTGLDPDVENRRILLKKVKGRLKKNKATSSSSSSTDSTDSDSGMEQSLLEERSRIKKLSEIAPGVLSSEGLRAMKEHVLTANGTPWGEDKTTLPPVVSQYLRQHCLPKVSAPMAREMMTLGCIADCMLQARPAEATDICFQRIKSLEQMASGQSWMVSQKLEIIPGPEAGATSRAELQAAQKERQLDEKTKPPGVQGEKGKSKSQGKGKDREREKGKSKGKGSGKEEAKK